jgi:hypothetical protein
MLSHAIRPRASLLLLLQTRGLEEEEEEERASESQSTNKRDLKPRRVTEVQYY